MLKKMRITCITQIRTCFARFRSSSHNLMIEKGRHYGIDRAYRYCRYREWIEEDEFHVTKSLLGA